MRIARALALLLGHTAAALLIATAAGGSAAAMPARFSFDATPGNLPKQAVPSHYALSLRLDPAAAEFSGDETIELQVRQAMPGLMIHARELHASTALLRDSAGRQRPLEVVEEPAHQSWRLTPRDGGVIAPGAYRLRLAWTGSVQSGGEGLFAVPYASPDGERRMLATQFEAHLARRVFPCFDEPSFRARFTLDIQAPSAFEVVSNTRVARKTSSPDGNTHWRFERTPPMPTYLTSLQRRQRIYELVAHEVAHQWFGNLVTAAWWDEIWLNEAFATWLATKTTVHFNPSWQREPMHRFDIQEALQRDAMPATRAIRSGPVSEDAVFDVFDDITYDKGGSVLRMLEDWLGPEAFRRGLAAYLSERRYSNATAGDLWFHLSRASARDVAAMVASWTDQPGYPVIEVHQACEAGQTALSLSQSPFRLSGAAPAGLWQVPVRVRRGAMQRTLLLDRAEARWMLPGCDAARPVLANAGDVGFYRVAYSAAEGQRLREQLAELPAIDGLMLLDDTFALAQAGRQPVTDYLQAAARLATLPDTQAGPLALQVVSALDFIDQALVGTPERQAVQAFGRAQLSPLLGRVGWAPSPGEGDSTIRAHLRGDLIRTLAGFGDPEVRRRAVDTVRAALDGRGTEIEPTIRGAVLSAAAVGGDSSILDLLTTSLQHEGREQRRWELAVALGSTQAPEAADRVLALALNEALPANIVGRLPGWLSNEGRQAERAYEFASKNYEALARRAPEWGRLWILPGAASGANQPALAERMQAEEREKVGEAGDMTARMIAATVSLRAQFREREATNIGRALPASGPG